MNTELRRETILDLLSSATAPISASALAKELSVSRQVIVGDVALLRATGSPIVATPKGYLLELQKNAFPYIGVLACKHDMAGLKTELYLVVDYGGTIIDVTVDHVIYGQLSGMLNISSRYDADIFIEKVSAEGSKPLSNLTEGIHLHRIGCKDRQTFDI
ncbi:MAG: transcription repressor NadR, partial [Anaerovoracaceae bacterium]